MDNRFAIKQSKVDGAHQIHLAFDRTVDYVGKMNREIERIERKVDGPQGFLYELRVNQSVDYRDVRGKEVHLNAGDIWKYGETTTGMSRYSVQRFKAWCQVGQQYIQYMLEIKWKSKYKKS